MRISSSEYIALHYLVQSVHDLYLDFGVSLGLSRETPTDDFHVVLYYNVINETYIYPKKINIECSQNSMKLDPNAGLHPFVCVVNLQSVIINKS